MLFIFSNDKPEEMRIRFTDIRMDGCISQETQRIPSTILQSKARIILRISTFNINHRVANDGKNKNTINLNKFTLAMLRVIEHFKEMKYL